MLLRLTLTFLAFGIGSLSVQAQQRFLGQGVMSGEVTSTSVLLQTRLTTQEGLDENGDLPGQTGTVRFEWSTAPNFESSQSSEPLSANRDNDFIARHKVSSLRPGTRYYYRVLASSPDGEQPLEPTGQFQTLPSEVSEAPLRFLVFSCMNYNKFLHGNQANASGPLTATDEDKRLGYPALVPMRDLSPAFFVGTGDIVYYDNPYRNAETLTQLRQCWHEQFRFPRLIDFLKNVPGYWSKDDHDFRFNDSDHGKDRLPLPQTGIDAFREQLPIVPAGDHESPTYRTFRVNQHLQIWLTEGRDYRSLNRMKDGPQKTLWGKEQKQWLQDTLKASDAKWKLLISPTPLVGPDDAYKKDNHANLKGFRHEADEFFAWLQSNQIERFMTICGDRHWQYHSIHPSGVHEFACGALNDENSRKGVPPGSPKGTDPEALVVQPFLSPEPSGGFLSVTAGENLLIEFYNDEGKRLYEARP
ncbi:alkaline phosphatase D family protein [Rhodopirellula sp. P2]|uniref:alkaline phosphatase D family protein n=1 Tax=Rhodopirellula sp. P2 TaxID=2127060 RepID=UPI002368EFE5|nr:alkaline phosphatase D family protein [Rhodopirellula sp. P2]WDQ19266.1 alkaline phosphatase D family protein [Rhodopirellula sp. P2]